MDARGKLGGIACPPELLNTIPSDKGLGLHLFHYERDLLFCWQPTFDSFDYIQSLHCVCTIVINEWSGLHDHFGKSEHAYGHWIDLPTQAGWFQLWRFLQELPSAAEPKLRDVTPLRLMSWLSYQLSQRTSLLIKECMAEFSQIEPVQSDKILQIGRFHLTGVGDAWETWDQMKDAVIDEVTIRGRAQQPAVVVNLIRGFLQRLPLPRLLHFLDLVLPQMVCSPAQAVGSQFPGSQLIRDLWLERDKGAFVQEPDVRLMRMFHSHAGIEHFRVEWNNQPILLFPDMEAKEYSNAWTYQNAKAATTTRQNVTMGLKKGNTVLLHFQYNGQLFQAILMMSGSVPGSKGGVDTHKLWKHVIPRSTDFAWLAREIAEAFCLPALYFNQSMDPWERTGAAPQGWASHLHQSVLPVQGYIQLRPQDTTLPSFGGCSAVPAGTGSEPADSVTAAPCRVGRASPSVSIFCPSTSLP